MAEQGKTCFYNDSIFFFFLYFQCWPDVYNSIILIDILFPWLNLDSQSGDGQLLRAISVRTFICLLFYHVRYYVLTVSQ